MSTTLPITSIALTILQQAGQAGQKPQQPALAGNAVLAVANGIQPQAGAQSQAHAKISDALISSDESARVTERKMQLFRSLGQELGFNMDDFKDPKQYAKAIRMEIQQIKLQPNGEAYLSDLAHKLGFDDLGVTIDNVVGAIDDPDGESAQKLDNAIRKELGLSVHSKEAEKAKAALKALTVDGSGLYGPGSQPA